MNRLTKDKRRQVVAALVEGNSIRSTVRMTGVAKNTISKLLVNLGCVCSEYQHHVMHHLECERIQCDEIWSYCYAKQKNLPPDKKGRKGFGDVYTWVALDADTKLVPTWLVGSRNARCANAFIADLAGRLTKRVQLTTDGYKAYLEAVEGGFGGDVDYATLVKLYGEAPEAEKRYSPAKCIGAEIAQIVGNPDPADISTSYVERQNLTMRMSMRRFTRLTNGFSKKIENLSAAIALHFMHYNFCRIHASLRVTPAMAAKVTDHLWEIDEIIDLLESEERGSN